MVYFFLKHFTFVIKASLILLLYNRLLNFCLLIALVPFINLSLLCTLTRSTDHDTNQLIESFFYK